MDWTSAQEDFSLWNDSTCVCTPPADFHGNASSYSKWIAHYFGDCVWTLEDKCSFYLGLVSLGCYVIALFPQLYHTYKRKSVQGLSLGLLVNWTVGDLLNFSGTLLAQQLPTQQFIALYFLLADLLTLLQFFWYSHWEKQKRQSAPRVVFDSGAGLTGPMPSLIQGKAKPKKPLKSDWNDLQYDYSDSDEETLLDSKDQPSSSATYSTLSHTGGSSSTVRNIPLASKALTQATLLSITLVSLVSANTSLFDHDATPKICNPPVQLGPVAYILGTIMAWISGLVYLYSRVPQIFENHRQKSVQGLSLFLFCFTILGNLTYGMSVILRFPPLDAHFFAATLPYLLGSMGVLFLDFVILGQFLQFSKSFKRGEDQFVFDSSATDVEEVETGASLAYEPLDEEEVVV